MNKWLWSLLIGCLILFSLIVWPLVKPLFVDVVVDESFPVVSSNLSDNDSSTRGDSVVLFDGFFVDADSFHKTSGKVLVVGDAGKRYVRFDDFRTTNGPDLYVYLATDTSAVDYVSLGVLKGNVGSQNYEVPLDVDLYRYNRVLIWCEDFSVLFGSALLE